MEAQLQLCAASGITSEGENAASNTRTGGTSEFEPSKICRPSAHEIDIFHYGLSQCTKPALLSLVRPYSAHYTECREPDSGTKRAEFLTSLYNDCYVTLSLPELQTIAETIIVEVSQSQAEAIENETRGQSSNSEWFQSRAGRVTASKLKAVCATDCDKPSISLLKSVCYPADSKFRSAATDWGIKKETEALEKYKTHISTHFNVTVDMCGFHVNSDLPFMGASPDARVNCSCCGKGVVEIKCPYNFREKTVAEYIESPDGCFEVVNGDIVLKRNHAHYYQTLAQMFICDVNYCDLVLCTFPSGQASAFVARLYRNEEFWHDCLTCKSVF
jgi:hypothetical protein